jgi:hypothetical protein
MTLIHHEPTNIYGGSFFSNLKNALMKGHDFVKKNKLLSKGLSLINHPYAKAASVAARAVGYGQGGAVVSMPRYYEDLEELNMKGGKRRKTRKSKTGKGKKSKSSKMSRRSLKRRGGALEISEDQKSQQESDSQSQQESNDGSISDVESQSE